MWMSLVFAYDYFSLFYFILYRIYLGEEGKSEKKLSGTKPSL